MKEDKLAIEGGTPVVAKTIPYARQSVGDDDIAAVVEVLESDWLTTGPLVEAFEAALAKEAGVAEAVVFANGTAALHGAMYALDVTASDEVVVPAISFVASANCVVYQGGTPRFADVHEGNLLADVQSIEELINDSTKAIIVVDYAGHPCPYDELRALADKHGLPLGADACHALGGRYKGRKVGSLADLSVFSFHPAKHVTAGEGGAVVTDSAEYAQRMRVFRNHGITSDHRQRQQAGSWFYEMVDLGYNYRLSDIHCALGLSQLEKLEANVARRNEIARQYDEAFAGMNGLRPLACSDAVLHAYHLYVVVLDDEHLRVDRNTVFAALRAEGIGVNVHYVPIYLHPYYRQHFGTEVGQCPTAERIYERMLTLPMWMAMSDEQVESVIRAVKKVLTAYAT